MKYSIVVTTVESTVVEALDAKHAENLARKFQEEVSYQYETGKRGQRVMHVTAHSQRMTLSGIDDPEGRVLDAT